MNFEATNKSAVLAGVWAGVGLVVLGFHEDQLLTGNLSAFVTCAVVLLPGCRRGVSGAICTRSENLNRRKAANKNRVPCEQVASLWRVLDCLQCSRLLHIHPALVR